MKLERVLLTGASGGVATMLRPLLAKPGRVIRLLDLRPPQNVAAYEEVAEPGHLDEAMREVDAVLHLGGQSREAPVGEVIESNLDFTYRLFEAAKKAGVTRVVIASSSHAVGFLRRPADGSMIPADAPGRPDTLYGWSKVAMEALGRLYADRYGLDVICLRIGNWTPQANIPRALTMWLSIEDGARLIEASLSAPKPGYRLIWGISNNTRRFCSLEEGEAIGYFPQDDAEAFADTMTGDDSDEELYTLGGTWLHIPLGEHI